MDRSRKASAVSPSRQRKKSTVVPPRSPSRDKKSEKSRTRSSRRVSESTASLASEASAKSTSKTDKGDSRSKEKDKKLKMLGKEKGSLQKKWGTMVGELEGQMGSTERKESRRTSRSVDRRVSRIDNADSKYDKLKEALSKKRSSSAASSRHGGSESGASEKSGRGYTSQATPNMARRKSRIVIQPATGGERRRSQSHTRGSDVAMPVIGALGSSDAERKRSRSQSRMLDSSRDTPPSAAEDRRRSRSQGRALESQSRVSTPEVSQRRTSRIVASGGRANQSDGSDMERPASRGRSRSQVVDIQERRISSVRPSPRSLSQSRIATGESSIPRSSLTSHRSSSTSRLDSISVHSGDGRRSSKDSTSSQKQLLKNPKAVSINEKHARGEMYRYTRPLNPGEAPMTAKEKKKGVKFFKDVRDEAGEIVDEVLGRAVRSVYGKDAKHYTRHKSRSHNDICHIHDVRRVSNIHDVRRISNVNAIRKMSVYDQSMHAGEESDNRRRQSSIRPVPQSGRTSYAPGHSLYKDMDFDIEIGGGLGGNRNKPQSNIDQTTYNQYANYQNMYSNKSSRSNPGDTLESMRIETSHKPAGYYTTATSSVVSHTTSSAGGGGSLSSSTQSTMMQQGEDSVDASSRNGRINPPTLTRGAITKVLHELEAEKVNSSSNQSSEFSTNTWPLKGQSNSSTSSLFMEQSSTLPRASSTVSETNRVVRSSQSTPHIIQLGPPDSQPRLDLVPKNGPLSPNSIDFVIDTGNLKQQGMKEIDHQTFKVFHGDQQQGSSTKTSQSSEVSQTIKANLATIREEDEAKYGAYSNEPIIVADLIDNEGIKRPRGEIEVIGKQEKGRLYGTQPDVAMNKHQVLNFYLFNQPNSGEPKPKLGYAAQEVQMRMGDETEAYANVFINRDGSERQKQEVKDWLADQRPKSEVGSEDTELREAYLFHKQTQTMVSPQPSPPRRIKKEVHKQQVIRKQLPSPPPSPPKRRHRDTTHYITQTREIEKVAPEKELRSMSIQTDYSPPEERIKKARSVVVEAPTMLSTSQTTLYEQQNRRPTPKPQQVEYFDSEETVTTTMSPVPRFTENRHMEQHIEYQEQPPTPPAKVVPMHMKEETHTDIFTLIDRELNPEPPQADLVPVESESDDETVILEMTEIETTEQRIAMAIFEEVEFSYKKKEGGKVIESGSSSDRADIAPFWLPDRYEAVVDHKKQKITQVKETSQHGAQALESHGFPQGHQRHLEGPNSLFALEGGAGDSNVSSSEHAVTTSSSQLSDFQRKHNANISDFRNTQSQQQQQQQQQHPTNPKKLVHRSSVHHDIGEDYEERGRSPHAQQSQHYHSQQITSQQKSAKQGSEFKRDELPANKVSSLLHQYNLDEKILANPGMKPAEKHGFKTIESNESSEEMAEGNQRRTPSLKRQSAFRKVQKHVPVNGNDPRQHTNESRKYRSSTHMYVTPPPSEPSNSQAGGGGGGGTYYNSLTRTRKTSGGSSSGMEFVPLSPISVPNVDVPIYPNHVDGKDDAEPESLEIFERSKTTMKTKKSAPPPPRAPPPPPLKFGHSAQEQQQAHIVSQKSSRQSQWVNSFMSQTPPPTRRAPPPPASPTKAPAGFSKMLVSSFDPENVSFGKKTGPDMMRESNEMSFNLEKINVPSTPSSPTKKHTFEELEGHVVHSSQSEPTKQTKYARDKDGNVVKVTEFQHMLTKSVEYESDEEKNLQRKNSATNEQLGEGGYIEVNMQETINQEEEDDEDSSTPTRQSPHEYTGPEVVAEMERTLRPYYYESQSQTLDMSKGPNAGLDEQNFLYDMNTATLKPAVVRERDHLDRMFETMTTEL